MKKYFFCSFLLLISTFSFSSDVITFDLNIDKIFKIQDYTCNYFSSDKDNVKLNCNGKIVEMYPGAIFDFSGVLYKPEIIENNFYLLELPKYTNSKEVTKLPISNIGPVYFKNTLYKWDKDYHKYEPYDLWIKHQVIFSI